VSWVVLDIGPPLSLKFGWQGGVRNFLCPLIFFTWDKCIRCTFILFYLIFFFCFVFYFIY
jgi:hypothetical protein